jgi:putative ABC transport system permease protein
MMLLEMFVSFILLFALTTIIFKTLGNRLVPLGYDYENVWTLTLDTSISPDDNAGTLNDSIPRLEISDLMMKEVSSMKEVAAVAKNIYNIPYNDIYRSDLKYGDKTCYNVTYNATDGAYPEVMNLKMQEGRWFDAYDATGKEIPIVINGGLKEALFGEEPALNKVIQSGLYKVTGVVEFFKNSGEFTENTPHFFIMMKPEEIPWQLLLRSTPGSDEAFRTELVKRTSAVAKDWTITAGKLSDFRKRTIRIAWMPVIIISIISAFLIINILLGLMGLLWYNVNHRKSEIGLRKSVGAPTSRIKKQLIGEMLALATLGIIPGLIIALQFPLLRAFDINPGIYLLAILTATTLIYLLVTLSTLLPTIMAARIQPAEALHEE